MPSKLRLIRPKWLASANAARPIVEIGIANDGDEACSVAAPGAAGGRWSLGMEPERGEPQDLPLVPVRPSEGTLALGPGMREAFRVCLADSPGWEALPEGEFRMTVRYEAAPDGPAEFPVRWVGCVAAPPVRGRKPRASA